MKPIAISVVIFLILLTGLIVSTPRDTAADSTLHSNTITQRADPCCQGKRGNVNGSGIVDSGDLAALVSYLTGGGYVLPCPDAANVNGTGIVDSGDLAALVSYLTGGGYVLLDCPTLPVLTTTSLSAVAQTTAQCGGSITGDGGLPVTVRGVCWSTSPTPTIGDSRTIDGTGSGGFTSSMSGLTGKSLYYVRAYATNRAGTGYGNILSFYTTDSVGTMIDIDGNSYRTVKIGSQWWMAENLKVTHYRNGEDIPNVTDSTTWTALSTGAYCEYNNDVNNVSTYGRLYNWYAISDGRNVAPAGWHVPTDAEWKQLEITLGMSQAQADSTDGRGAPNGGKLKETGTAHWYTTNLDATDESGFTGLPGGCRNAYTGTYLYIRYFAYSWSSTEAYDGYPWYRYLNFNLSDIGRKYFLKVAGFSVRCVLGDMPTVSTASVTTITQTSARSGGTISSDGGAPVTARGVCWSTSPTPTIADSKTTDGTGIGSFTSSLTGLTAGTLYYVRAYATNSAGTGYGDSQSFTTAASNTVTDIDGNVYQTVTIGTQVWMKENLKVTHYRNGEAIPNVTDGTSWGALTTGAYCEYNNDLGNVATYGRLYNWYAVSDSRNIAPAGWHVPSDVEWKRLEMTLGMTQAQADSADWRGAPVGGKLKETGTAHWWQTNADATNESGFSALAGGYRSSVNGPYDLMGLNAFFWSSTVLSSYDPWTRSLYCTGSSVFRYYGPKGYGFSVRCVRD